MEYILDKAKKEIKKLLGNQDLEVETPPENIGVDLAVPIFKMAAKQKINPNQLANELLAKIKLDGTLFSKVEAKGAYLNFYFNNNKFIEGTINDFKSDDNYGSSDFGKGKTIVIDYSAPNIGKPFSIGHLRSTIIGQSLYNILSYLGYKVIGDNHIGDWGTQFGKLIAAYKKWGSRKEIEKEPIKKLLELYIKFHEKAGKDEGLNDDARKWFKKLEGGDKEAIEIWQWFKDLSLKEFDRIYRIIGIKFDETIGESCYKKYLDRVVEKLEKEKIAIWEIALDKEGEEVKSGEKVLLVNLEKFGIDTPLLFKKSDGTSLYATRDLAAIIYRLEKWHPFSILYVVGAEQKLYFQQLFKTFEIGFKKDYKSLPLLDHISFGMIRLPEGKMSTRKGRVVFLEDVLDEAIKRVNDILSDREMNKDEKDKVSKIVGIGAIKYADLSQNRIHDVMFDWNKILNLKGNSGPYLQYQYVRINSILEKTSFDKNTKIDSGLLSQKEELDLIKFIARFNERILASSQTYEPHILANYLFELAEKFSRFYEKVPVLKADNQELINSRLYLCYMTSQVLKTGLNLLGIDAPEKM